MMRVRAVLHSVLGVALLSAMPAVSLCEEETQAESDVSRAVEQLEGALSSEPGLRPESRRRLLELLRLLADEQSLPDAGPTHGEVADIVDESIAASPATSDPSALDEIIERLAPYADFRFRHESTFPDDGRSDRHRQRLRLRFGVNYQATENLLVGARLRTGSRSDPRSPHVTLGDLFGALEVSLDRAFVTWKPAFFEDRCELTLGKFNHPLDRNPVYGELVQDADVQPEGCYARWVERDIGPLDRLQLVVGEYVLLEQSNAADAFATVAQLSGRFQLGAGFVADVALGYTFYTDLSPDGSTRIFNSNDGNRAVDRDGDGNVDDFASDFGILHPIVSLSWDGLGLPLTVAAEYIWNTEARTAEGQTSRDEGLAIGCSLGASRARGDIRFYYQWQLVEQDAVFSPFAQDDFLFATCHRSHLVGVSYRLSDGVEAQLWGLASRPDDRRAASFDDDGWRVRLDLNFKL